MAQPEFTDYEKAVTTVRSRLVEYAAAVWATAEFTDSAMAALVAAMVPRVLAGQLRIANLTAAYFGRATGTRPALVANDITRGRRTDPAVVYERPIITTRTLVSRGESVDVAKEAGGRRLQSLVTTDLEMAKIRQADRALLASGLTHYRRVPKGESTCAMCLIASTQRYNTGRLLPIHPGCDCGVDVIPEGMDLDEVIDPARLEATHQKVQEFAGISDRQGRAVDYRKLLITHDHGELGEVIAWRGQKFTGPADLVVVDLDA